MPTLDEITLEEDAARRRREAHVATVRPLVRGESGQYWCHACRSPSCPRVLELVTTARSG